MSVWPTSPACRFSRNGVVPSVRASISAGARLRWRFKAVARPDRRERHHMGEVQRVEDRLADIGIDMPWEAPEPGIDRVEGLPDHREPFAIDDALGVAGALLGTIRGIRIG
jgi:hypothetical protein